MGLLSMHLSLLALIFLIISEDFMFSTCRVVFVRGFGWIYPLSNPWYICYAVVLIDVGIVDVVQFEFSIGCIEYSAIGDIFVHESNHEDFL